MGYCTLFSCEAQFTLQYKDVLTFDCRKKGIKFQNFLSVTILVKTTEHYFPLVQLFIVLYKVILTFESCG